MYRTVHTRCNEFCALFLDCSVAFFTLITKDRRTRATPPYEGQYSTSPFQQGDYTRASSTLHLTTSTDVLLACRGFRSSLTSRGNTGHTLTTLLYHLNHHNCRGTHTHVPRTSRSVQRTLRSLHHLRTRYYPSVSHTTSASSHVATTIIPHAKSAHRHVLRRVFCRVNE